MPTNHAAYLPEKQAPKLDVREAPYVEPQENQILIKTTAMAINPVDWKIQSYGMFFEKYPNILGCDVAGTVAAAHSSVKGFSSGDRVFGHCMSLATGNQAQAGYQEYVILQAPLFAKTPSNIKDEEAVVLPLGIDTAASALFEDAGLGMKMPPSTEGKGKTLFVWGGSSSVGSCAIQLASAAGYEVVTSASKHNFDFCKQLGASQVFDYKDSKFVDDVVAALKGKDVVGALDSISEQSTVPTSCEILAKSGGKKLLQTVLPGSDSMATEGVTVHPVFGITPAWNAVGPHIWQYLPKALQEGSFKAKPDPVSAGKGLESLQNGMDMNKKGVSGKKVVVTL